MNKKLVQVFLTILAAAAMVQCGGPVASEGTCRSGICVNLELLEPIRLDAPVTVVITVETEEDIPGLGVYLRFSDPDIQVEGERMWEELNAQADTPLQFSTIIRFPKEGNFIVIADAHDPHRGLTVRDGFTLEITQLGATTTFGPMTREPAPLAVCRRDGFPPNPICGTIATIEQI